MNSGHCALFFLALKVGSVFHHSYVLGYRVSSVCNLPSLVPISSRVSALRSFLSTLSLARFVVVEVCYLTFRDICKRCISQLLVSILIDHFGIFGCVRHFSPQRVNRARYLIWICSVFSLFSSFFYCVVYLYRRYLFPPLRVNSNGFVS